MHFLGVLLLFVMALFLVVVGLQVYQAGYERGERDGWNARKAEEPRRGNSQ